MVSISEVFNFMRNTGIEEKLPHGEVSNTAYVALEMVHDLARVRGERESIYDLTTAFQWLCKIPFPGAPPKTEAIKQAVSRIIMLYSTIRENPFDVTPAMLKETPHPLNLRLKRVTLRELGIRSVVTETARMEIRLGEVIKSL